MSGAQQYHILDRNDPPDRSHGDAPGSPSRVSATKQDASCNATSPTLPLFQTKASPRNFDSCTFLDHHPVCIAARWGTQDGAEFLGLLDNGSNISIISTSMLKQLHDGSLPKLEKPGCNTVQGVGSSTIAGCIHLPFWLEGLCKGVRGVAAFETTFYVLDNFGPGFCIGLDVIGHYGIDTLITRNLAVVEVTQGLLEIDIAFARSRPKANGANPGKTAAKWHRAMASSASAEALHHEMKAAKDVLIPPRTRMFVSVGPLPGGDDIDWLFAPRLTEDPARKLISMAEAGIGRRSCTGRGRKGLLVHNFSDGPFPVHKGMTLADATPLPTPHVYKASFGFNMRTGEPVDYPQATSSQATSVPASDSLAFDPNDGDEGSARAHEEAKAQVEEQVPSSVVDGCNVAHDAMGRPYPEVVELIRRHHAAFSTDGKPGFVAGEQLRIPIKKGEEHLLKPQGLRPMGPAKREIERQAIEEFLKDGVIEESDSELSFPVVIVRQGDKHRYCIDYRELNKHTVPDRYPMQRSDVLFSSLGGNRYFSSLDAARGYHQIPVHPEERWKTAFATHRGFFQWVTMPFGLRNAPAVFQRLMETKVLGQLRWQQALVYIDDVVVYSASLPEHVQALDKILSNASSIGLKFSSKKCFFAYPSLRLLGRLISQDGLETLFDRTKAIRELERPHNLQDLRRIIGIFGFYRSFIPNYARRVAPLTALQQGLVYEKDSRGHTRLMRRDAQGNLTPVSATAATLPWGDKEQAAFDDLKSALESPPCLAFPIDGLPYIIYVDAAHSGISVILHQLQPVNRYPAATSHCLIASPFEVRLREQQEQDPLFAPILERCSNNEAPAGYELLSTNDGSPGALVISVEGKKKWCLPETMVKDALHDLHDCLGHPGIERTTLAVQSRFWRPGLATKIRDYVNCCDECQRSKKTRQKPAGEISEDREVRPAAYDCVSMDLVTGLPRTTGGLDSILIIECLWSKAVTLIPTKSTLTSTKLAELWFKHIVTRGWLPSVIVSDRGPQFLARFWRKLQGLLGTRLAFSAAHHQRANPVERAVQTMETTLRAFCAGHPQDWLKHIPYVEFAMNSLTSSTTGYAPFDLLYTSRTVPWAIVSERAESDVSVFETARAMVKDAVEARKLATRLYQHWFNRRHSSPPPYKVGDLVLVRLDERPLVEGDSRLSKLDQRCKGPWPIKRVISKITVELDLPAELSKTSPIFTVDQLKPYRSVNDAEKESSPIPVSNAPAAPQEEDYDSSVSTDSSDSETEPSGEHSPSAPTQRQSSRLAGRPRRSWDRRTHAQANPAHPVEFREFAILYWSRQLRGAEPSYNITELELLGCKEGVVNNRIFLEGAEGITVVTDHRPLLTILNSTKELSANTRVDRFRLALQGYDIKVVYREGRQHLNADALSRLPRKDWAANSNEKRKISPLPCPTQIFQGGPPAKDADPFNILKQASLDSDQDSDSDSVSSSYISVTSL